jgi:exopolyphosphatase / guanosine-5'-triphosphate,3'-diphosphate pyrophosphatase
MARYAAIDIGSNSIRMLAAEAVAGQALKVLAEDRQVTRLGESVFRQGRLSDDAMTLAVQVLTRMAQSYQKLDVMAVRAVATSAVRDSSNQAQFLQRASFAIGSPVEIVSGQEEARLIHLGVEARWPQGARRVLIVDIGGGSAEFIVAQGGALERAVSKPLGAVRLTEVFLPSNPPTPVELHRLTEFVDEKLHTVVASIGARRCDRVIATSASAAAVVCAINRVPRAKRETADRLRAATRQVRKLFRELSAMDLAARRRVPGIGPRRAEIIVPGALVFLRTLETYSAPSMYYLAAGVRDGIVADLAARGAGSELARLSREQRRMVEEMARRYGVALPHARRVAQLAHSLFIALEPLHRLPAAQGKLLEAAAYLHDVGHYVSDTGHHKHSAYVVANSDMPGFNAAERRTISLLCRYHRKSMPQARHEGFSTLNPETRRTVQLMVPLLRLADSFDRSHEQRVERVQCHLRDGQVLIEAAAAGSADIDLEVWAAERIAPAFRESYVRDLLIVKGKQR